MMIIVNELRMYCEWMVTYETSFRYLSPCPFLFAPIGHKDKHPHPSYSPILLSHHPHSIPPTPHQPPPNLPMPPLPHLLHSLAHLYDRLHDRFRADVYREAALLFGEYHAKGIPLPTTLKGLMALKGVGKSIAQKVLEYQRTGTIRKVHDLQHDPVIQAQIKLLTVFGIGPVKAKQLVSPPLSLRTLKDLRQAHRQGTAGLQRAQILGLTHYTDLHTRIPYEEGRRLEEALRPLARRHPGSALQLVGSYRRHAKTLGDIDILLKHLTISQLESFLRTETPFTVVDTITRGTIKASFLLRIDTRVRHLDVLVTPPDEYIPALLYFTGSKVFNIRMRMVAKEKGWALSEHGMEWVGHEPDTEDSRARTTRNPKRNPTHTSKRTRSGKCPHAPRFQCERDVFRFLGMGWVAPEDR